MKAFAALYRRLDSGTSTRAKQAAMVEFFATAKADPTQWASAAWTVYFLSGGKPRQTAPSRLLWRLAVEGSGYPEWLCAECYGAVGDLAEMLSLLLPEGEAGEDVSLDVWMRERLLPLPSLPRKSVTRGSNDGSARSRPTSASLSSSSSPASCASACRGCRW